MGLYSTQYQQIKIQTIMKHSLKQDLFDYFLEGGDYSFIKHEACKFIGLID